MVDIDVLWYYAENVVDNGMRCHLVPPPLDLHLHQAQARGLPLQRDAGEVDATRGMGLLHEVIRLYLWHVRTLFID